MLDLQKVSFSYSDHPFISDLSLKIAEGEHVSIIGASGSGKSTLLQIIYGLHHVKGKLFWKKRQLLGPNYNLVPGEDVMKYLTQDFDLMPSLSSAENIGKFLSNAFPRKKERRIKELLELVEMKELRHTKARFLSGGQQQRIALARVLAKEPEVLLLDEPFSHIDHFQKNKLRRNIFNYLKEKEITCLVATHDITDALSFADTTLVMKDGKVRAKGTPQELYQNPKDAYVSALFGDINVLPLNMLLAKEKRRKKVILYPHEITKTQNSALQAVVIRSYFKGSAFLVEANLQGMQVLFEHAEKLEKNAKVALKVSEELIRSRIND